MSVAIALDGPAGAGKSSIAKRAAKALDFIYGRKWLDVIIALAAWQNINQSILALLATFCYKARLDSKRTSLAQYILCRCCSLAKSR